MLFPVTEPDIDERYLCMFIRTVILYISLFVAIGLGLFVAYAEFVLGFEDSDYMPFPEALDGLGAAGFHAFYHGQVMGWVVLLFVPLCFAVFMVHAKLGRYDVFRHHLKRRYRDIRQRRTFGFRVKNLFLALFGMAIGVYGSFNSFAGFCGRGGCRYETFEPVHDSMLVMTFYGIFGAAVHTVLAVFFFWSLLILWGLLSDLLRKA